MADRQQGTEETRFLENGATATEVDGDTEVTGSKKGSITIEMEEPPERGVWSNKLQFFLAIMGYTIGIGSVWRFPIICR